MTDLVFMTFFMQFARNYQMIIFPNKILIYLFIDEIKQKVQNYINNPSKFDKEQLRNFIYLSEKESDILFLIDTLPK
jgi:hypothetical protein